MMVTLIMVMVDIFMIIFMWMWGQTAPKTLKEVFTVLLILFAILKLFVYIKVWNEKGEQNEIDINN